MNNLETGNPETVAGLVEKALEHIADLYSQDPIILPGVLEEADRKADESRSTIQELASGGLSIDSAKKIAEEGERLGALLALAQETQTRITPPDHVSNSQNWVHGLLEIVRSYVEKHGDPQLPLALTHDPEQYSQEVEALADRLVAEGTDQPLEEVAKKHQAKRAENSKKHGEVQNALRSLLLNLFPDQRLNSKTLTLQIWGEEQTRHLISGAVKYNRNSDIRTQELLIVISTESIPEDQYRGGSKERLTYQASINLIPELIEERDLHEAYKEKSQEFGSQELDREAAANKFILACEYLLDKDNLTDSEIKQRDLLREYLKSKNIIPENREYLATYLRLRFGIVDISIEEAVTLACLMFINKKDLNLNEDIVGISTNLNQRLPKSASRQTQEQHTAIRIEAIKKLRFLTSVSSTNDLFGLAKDEDIKELLYILGDIDLSQLEKIASRKYRTKTTVDQNTSLLAEFSVEPVDE